MSSAGKNYRKSYTNYLSCMVIPITTRPDQGLKWASFFHFFFFKGSGLVHGEKYFSTFFICCESTPTRLTHLTTFGHEIVNNVENTCVTNVFRFWKWLLKSCIWCFPTIFLYSWSMFASVFIPFFTLVEHLSGHFNLFVKYEQKTFVSWFF